MRKQVVLHYRAGTADELVLKESFEHDIYLKMIPEYQPAPGHILIDIGAHIGCFSMLMAGRLTKGKIYAFEPSKESFELLEKNVSDNNLANVSPLPLAISDKTGTAYLYHDLKEGNWAHSITRTLSAKKEAVQTVRLSDFMKKKIYKS